MMGEREGGWAAGPENAWRRRREHLARWCRRFRGMIFLWAARGVVREADLVISLMLGCWRRGCDFWRCQESRRNGPRRGSIIRIEACRSCTGTVRPSRGTRQTPHSWIGHLQTASGTFDGN